MRSGRKLAARARVDPGPDVDSDPPQALVRWIALKMRRISRDFFDSGGHETIAMAYDARS